MFEPLLLKQVFYTVIIDLKYLLDWYITKQLKEKEIYDKIDNIIEILSVYLDWRVGKQYGTKIR